MDDANVLTKEEEKQLLQCSNFYELLDIALNKLEDDDYYTLTIPLRDLQAILHKLVVAERARIYSVRLKAISARLDDRSSS